MEKIRKEEVKAENIYHDFYCDRCNKHIGTSQEYDDGYYTEQGEVELKVRICKTTFTYQKCLCDDCRIEELDRIKNGLLDLGFEVQFYG